MTPDEERKSMDERLAMAREGGGSDTFGAVASLGDDKSDDADTKVANDGPEYGPVDFPPPTPADVAPPPDAPPEQPFADYSPTKPPAADPSRDVVRQLAGSVVGKRYTPSAAVSDAAIAKAQGADRSRREHDNFTAALSSALLRRPYQAPSDEGTAPDLLQARAREQADFEHGKQQDLSAAALMARALKGEKPAPTESQSLVDWRRAQADRLKGLEARDAAAVEETKRKGTAAATADEAEKASLDNERALLMKDPRVKAFGLTAEDLAKLDRKGLDGVRRQIETVKQPKSGGAGGGGPGGGGHRLPPSALSELASYDAADEELGKLEEEGVRTNIGSLKNRVVSMIPSDQLKANTDIGKYEDAARRAMQGVGIILEHGKLAAGDELKYKRLLPEAGDSADTLHRKISGLRAYLKSLKAKTEGAYGAGGYKVPQSGGNAPPAPHDAPKKTPRERALELKKAGFSNERIAQALNDEGY